MLDEVPGSLIKELTEKLDLPIPWDRVASIDIRPSHIRVGWFRMNDAGRIVIEDGDVVLEGCAMPIRWAR